MDTSSTDPNRVGGIDWLTATRGHLTAPQRRRARREVARGVGALARTRLALLLGRDAVGTLEIPSPPDSRLAADAEERCAEQSPAVAGHARRTWAYGRLLAQLDGVGTLDDELFYVASLLHDTGLGPAVRGEDFTLRSAACARQVAGHHCTPTETRRIEDAIAAHCTPGATLAADGPEGYYVHTGAALDLVGLRVDEIPAATIEAVNTEYPRADVTDEIRRLIREEARAVPTGRFAVFRNSGFNVTIRLAPKRLRTGA